MFHHLPYQNPATPNHHQARWYHLFMWAAVLFEDAQSLEGERVGVRGNGVKKPVRTWFDDCWWLSPLLFFIFSFSSRFAFLPLVHACIAYKVHACMRIYACHVLPSCPFADFELFGTCTYPHTQVSKQHVHVQHHVAKLKPVPVPVLLAYLPGTRCDAETRRRRKKNLVAVDWPRYFLAYHPEPLSFLSLQLAAPQRPTSNKSKVRGQELLFQLYGSFLPPPIISYPLHMYGQSFHVMWIVYGTAQHIHSHVPHMCSKNEKKAWLQYCFTKGNVHVRLTSNWPTHTKPSIYK